MSKVLAVKGLFFSSSAIYTIGIVFVNLVFLASYPSKWLPLLFLFQSSVEFVVSYYIFPVIEKNPYRSALNIQIISLLLTVVFIILSYWPSYWMPLFLTVYILTISALSIVVTNNSSQVAFDVIEFKSLGNWSSAITSISSVCLSFVCIFFLQHFGSHSLFYILCFFLILSFLFLIPLKPLPVPVQRQKPKISLMKNVLFRNIFYCVIILTLASTFVDYAMKLKLATTYDKLAIGQFMGWLIAISGVVSVFISFIGIRLLINRYGTTSILLVVPIYWVITSIIAIFNPSIWVLAFMAAARYTIFTGFFNLGRQLVLNVLPNQMQIAAQFKVRVIATPISICTSALIIFLFSQYLSYAALAIIVLILCLISLFLLKNIHFDYIAALKNEVKLKRFNIYDNKGSSQIKDLIFAAFQSSNTDINRFGFSLLSQSEFQSFSGQLLLPFLKAKDADIRLSALKNLSRYPTPEALPILLQNIEHETDPSLQWELFNTLILLEPELALNQANLHLADRPLSMGAGAIRVMVSQGNELEQKKALTALKIMARSESYQFRQYAALIMGYVAFEPIKTELFTLIQDDNKTVSVAAIKAATMQKIGDCADQVINQLVLKTGFYYAILNYLKMLGDSAIPLLERSIQQNKNNKKANLAELIRALCAFPSLSVEPVLISLSQESIHIRGIIAKEVAYRSLTITVSKDMKAWAFEQVKKEAQLIALLNHFIKTPGHFSNEVVREMESRAFLAQRRYLYWLAVYTNPHEIIGFMSTILFGAQSERAKAIELLNALLNHQQINLLTSNSFLTHKGELPEVVLAEPENYWDDWLNEIIGYSKEVKQGLVMQDLHKVFVLREVDLFKSLSGENLLIIAEEAELVEMHQGEVIFRQDDPPTGLYIIVSGIVQIIKDGEIINELNENDFFGELALIDNSTRTASAFAKTEGALLYLDKNTFERITDDLPEVLRSVIQTIMVYLRGYIH